MNGIPTLIMINTSANVSLIDSSELDRIYENSKKIISTLSIYNIVLIGVTDARTNQKRK